MGLHIWGAKVVINIFFKIFCKEQPLCFEFLTQKDSSTFVRYYKKTNCKTKANIFQ